MFYFTWSGRVIAAVMLRWHDQTKFLLILSC